MQKKKVWALCGLLAYAWLPAATAVLAPAENAGLVGGGAMVPPPTKSLRVFPARVRLDNLRDVQRVVVQWRDADGITTDVSTVADVRSEDPSKLSVNAGVLRPLANGATTLIVRHGGETVRVPVEVRRVEWRRPTSFQHDVLPILTRTGCNSGRCHGAARGQDGFHISLFGFDPRGDFKYLTEQLPGRRVNLARPDNSLLLQKALGKVPHTGGKRFGKDSMYYRAIHEWIQNGAKDDPQDIAVAVGVDIYPQEAVLAEGSGQQRVVVMARYSDGTDRDVSDMAVFSTTNENTAPVSADGIVKAGASGEAFVMARFDTFTVGVPVIVIGKQQQPVDSSKWESFNYVDQTLHQKFTKLRIEPSGLCSDAAFVRRVHIDLQGRLPSRAVYDRFLADQRPDKRARLIDDLLQSEGFASLWTLKWGDLLGIRRNNQTSPKALYLYHAWLKDKVKRNVPANHIVRDILRATGGTLEVAATNFYQIENNTQKLAENVAQSFFGLRIACAQCHNHPFDTWTMDDYYGFVAFFSQVGFKESHDPREFIVFDKGDGEIQHPVHKSSVKPRYLGAAVAKVGDRDRRAVLADWVAGKDNPYLATNLANIIWAHHFGRGIIEPVDDARVSNPASHPDLLKELGRRLVSYDYDLRRLIRDICNSAAYQRATKTNATNAEDLRNFSRAYVRRMRAEVLLDCISMVTDTNDSLPRLPEGAKAVELPEGSLSTYFLDTFGRSKRETVCSCEVKTEPNLSQALHLLNGENTNAKVRNGKVVEQLLAKGLTPEQVIEELYLRCYSRKPTAKDLQRIRSAAGRLDAAALQDVFWALLNSKEFLFNH